MVMPMNVKEFDNFFGNQADQLAIFRPKRIFCVPMQQV